MRKFGVSHNFTTTKRKGSNFQTKRKGLDIRRAKLSLIENLLVIYNDHIKRSKRALKGHPISFISSFILKSNFKKRNLFTFEKHRNLLYLFS